MNYIGIDIGSTAAKVVVRGEKELAFTMPTGWSSKETALTIRENLKKDGINMEEGQAKVVATGYGRSAVDYADYVITEITCHARGGRELGSDHCAVIDVGGQDTKVILIENGMVQDFLMNDKCSAGTGKFLEIMANRLGVTLQELFDMAAAGNTLSISSLCTVFAESEVISLRSAGVAPEAILAGVINAMARRSANFIARLSCEAPILFTGGVSHCQRFTHMLESHLGMPVQTHPDAQFAGAIGAAVIGQRQRKRA